MCIDIPRLINTILWIEAGSSPAVHNPIEHGRHFGIAPTVQAEASVAPRRFAVGSAGHINIGKNQRMACAEEWHLLMSYRRMYPIFAAQPAAQSGVSTVPLAAGTRTQGLWALGFGLWAEEKNRRRSGFAVLRPLKPEADSPKPVHSSCSVRPEVLSPHSSAAPDIANDNRPRPSEATGYRPRATGQRGQATHPEFRSGLSPVACTL